MRSSPASLKTAGKPERSTRVAKDASRASESSGTEADTAATTRESRADAANGRTPACAAAEPTSQAPLEQGDERGDRPEACVEPEGQAPGDGVAHRAAEERAGRLAEHTDAEHQGEGQQRPCRPPARGG